MGNPAEKYPTWSHYIRHNVGAPDHPQCYDAENRYPDICGYSNDGVNNDSLAKCKQSCVQKGSSCTGIQWKSGNCDLVPNQCDYNSSTFSRSGSWHIVSRKCFD